jgi:hypothetical protein
MIRVKLVIMIKIAGASVNTVNIKRILSTLTVSCGEPAFLKQVALLASSRLVQARFPQQKRPQKM